MSAPDTKLPNIAALLCIIIGLLIGLIGGFKSGSIFGAVVAGFGIIPACWGMWAGIQNKESQAGMLYSVLLFLAAVGLAGLMLLLRFVDFLS